MKLLFNSNWLNSNQSSCDFQTHSSEASSTLEQEVLTCCIVVSGLTLGQILPFLTSLFRFCFVRSEEEDRQGRHQTNNFNTITAWSMEAQGSFKGEVANPASTEKNFLCRGPSLMVNNLSDRNARKNTDMKAKSAKILYSESCHMQPCPSFRISVYGIYSIIHPSMSIMPPGVQVAMIIFSWFSPRSSRYHTPPSSPPGIMHCYLELLDIRTTETKKNGGGCNRDNCKASNEWLGTEPRVHQTALTSVPVSRESRGVELI